jgi:hypothetical protein
MSKLEKEIESIKREAHPFELTEMNAVKFIATANDFFSAKTFNFYHLNDGLWTPDNELYTGLTVTMMNPTKSKQMFKDSFNVSPDPAVLSFNYGNARKTMELSIFISNVPQFAFVDGKGMFLSQGHNRETPYANRHQAYFSLIKLH